MFDFSKYNLGELNAIMDILQYIYEGGRIDYQQEKCREAIYENLCQQAAALPVYPTAQANCILNNCGVQLLNCPMADPSAEEVLSDD